jgi:hypothetical protein
VAANIRKMPELDSLKIIAYTAASGIVTENGMLNPEFDAVILKPATREVILNELKKFIAFEEITTQQSSHQNIFKFDGVVSELIAKCVYEIVGVPEKKLTNRQIIGIIDRIKTFESFLIDNELQRFISILSGALDDFNVVLIENLSGEMINHFISNKSKFC